MLEGLARDATWPCWQSCHSTLRSCPSLYGPAHTSQRRCEECDNGNNNSMPATTEDQKYLWSLQNVGWTALGKL